MISTFSFPTTIRFGAGAIRELPVELRRLGTSRPLLVTDSGLAATETFQRVVKEAGEQVACFSGVHPNPTESDVEAATAAFKTGRCDAVVAVGGGSALDVGKAIRLRIKR